MNTQEREQLNRFLSQLVAAHAGQKDTEAEGLIRDAVTRQPDAAYLLVQKAFLLEQAVASAQSRIEQLQGEVEALRANAGRSSFADAGQWGNSAARTAAPPAMPQYTPAPATSAPSATSGWLGNIASTAAGVAAGAFLFQGIESLLGHHGSNSLLGGNAFGQSGETTVVNNFFEAAPLADSSNDFASLSDGLDDSNDSWI